MKKRSPVSVLAVLLAFALLGFAACTTPDDGDAGEIHVVNINAPSITVYSRTASGDTAPLRTIAGAATGLSQPYAIAIDTIHSEIFVANLSGNSITVYSRTASGDTAPIRTLAGSANLVAVYGRTA
jgi:hypothetical protein